MANGGTFHYGVEFDVNKASLSSISTALSQLQKITGSDLMKLDKSLNLSEAIEKVAELKKTISTVQEALKNSYNVKLNSTNLTTFNKELERSGLSVKTLYTQLSSAGQAGQEAFKKISTNLLTTNLELKESNTLLDKMAQTMSNTVKWGISSSIFNKITGSIQNAYNYTLKLDKSLNAIRRVSNATADDMERFAKYANTAAKSLGSSTLDYTEGALIYFQQGLSEQEAKKRTDVTVKMANVLGATAEEVSNYMTAIWNNFDDGSSSLEHFADVITKLGAKTASSSEEIATGLEKFAAISKTVGLSYEYATAALATVVAQTRQSADTVGTAFKTLFSRIEGLSLGETLDDGTTLNKYSEALRKIGVEIKDSSGNLKKMDTILDEMGAKWQSLTEAQKVATAQTVGGVRQYSQLLALMDNWDKFSENLQTAYNSTGELERQQGIYMESAEAHLKTMEAAFEGLYDSIFDENSIKEIADIITVVVDRLSTFIRSIGGGGNALLGLGSIALRVFDDQIGRGLASTINNLKSAKQNITELQAQLKLIQDIGELNIDDKMLKTLVGWKQEILNLGEVVSAEQHNEANELIKERALIEENQQAWEKDLEAAEEYFARTDNVKHGSENVDASKENIAIESKDASLKSDYEAVIDARIDQINKYQKELEQLEQAEAKYYQSLAAGTEEGAEAVETATDSIITSIKELISSESLTTEQTKNLGKALEEYLKIDEDEDPQAKENALQNLLNKFKQVNAEVINESENTRNVLNRAAANEGEAYEDAARKAESKWDEFFKSLKTGAAIKSFVQLAGSIGQVASALSSLSHLSDIWNDKDLSTGEKAIQIVSILGTALPMLANGIKAIGVALKISVPEVLAIIAAIAVVVAVVNEFINILHKEERELEDAKKAVEEAQKAYEDLKSTIDSYSDARASIDKLTEGTIEFYQAIVKSNEEAQKLIDTLGLIFGEDYTIGKNGVITINDEALERSLFEQNQEVYRAQSREYSAQIALERKSQKAIVDKFAKEVNRLSQEQNPYSSGAITSNQAETILSNSKETNVLLGKIENVSKETNNSISEAAIKTANAIVDNGVDISSAITTYLPSYLESEQRQLVYKRQAAIAALQGYGTKEQNDQFNQQTSLSQKYIADILNNKSDDRKSRIKQSYDEEVTWGKALKTWGINFVSSLFRGDIGGAIASPYTTGAQLGREQGRVDSLKEEYLQATKHWSKDYDTNIVTDRSGKVISQETYNKALEKVDWKTARSAYNEGRLNTESDYGDISKTIDFIQNNKGNINETSRRRITEMVLGFQSGADEKELSEISKTLTNEEKQFISDRIKQKSTFTQHYSGDGKLQSEESWTGTGFYENADKNSSSWAELDMNIEDIQKYLELSDETSLSQERLALMSKEYSEELEKQANLLGTTTEALDFFRIAGQKAGKIQEGLSYETANTAAEQYKFNKNYNNAVSVYKKNETAIKAYGKALKNNKEISYDLADAMGEVQKSLKDMGLSLNAETISNHLDDINHLLNGTKKQAEEAYKKLYDLARKDVLKSFFGDKEEYSKFFDDIIKDIDATTPGQAMSEEYAKKLSEMITNTQMTVSEINALAEGLGITIPVEYDVPETLSVEDKELTTKATSTLHRYTGEMPNPGYKKEGDPKTIPVNYAWVETVEDKTDHFLVPKGTNFTVNTNKSNIGGKTNFSKSLGNSGSGKKSGGGKGSTAEPKHEKEIHEETDRYHKVNTQIAKVENQLKKVQSQQQKLVGSKLIENLNKQWLLLNTQIKNYNEKLKIANKEQQELAGKLANKGVKFNSDGTVANYEESIKAAEEEYNRKVRYYNSLSKAQQDKLDKQYEDGYLAQYKEVYDQFKTDIDRYDEIVVNIKPELEQQELDAIDKQIEINIQKFNLELEVTLKMNKATRQWNEWKKTHIDGIRSSDILGNANARLEDFGSYYNEKGTGDIQTQTRQVVKILAELDKMDKTGSSDIYGTDRQKALDELNEKYGDLMTSMTDAKQIQEELHQAVLEQIDASQEAFDKQVDNYNFLNSLLEHDKKVIQLVYGEKSYADLKKFYDKQQENYNDTLDFQRKETIFWEQQINHVKERASAIQKTMAKLEEEGKKDTTEWKNAYDQYQNVEEQLEKVTEQWKSSVQNFNTTLEESLQNAVDKFQNAINAIFEETNKKVTGGLGLDYVNEQWELINKNANRYLDTVNKTYGIRELEKKYTDAINKSSNINTQQKLKKIMDEQLSNLKDRDRLTQYELDRANKLYDIELAKVALEDAQMNKSQMRLRRDSQGNYTYQYVANDDKIREAEDKIEALYNQLYNFDKERYNSVLNDAYNTWNEYQQKMAEAAMINDPEERAKKEALIQEQYDELMTQIEQDYQISRKDLQQSLFANLAVMTMDSFSQTNKEYGIALTNAEGKTTVSFGNISDSIKETFEGADNITKDTFDDMVAIIESANYKIDGFNQNTFDNLIAGYENLDETSKDIITNGLVETWSNGISDMVEYFIHGDSNNGMEYVAETFSDDVSSMQELFVGKDGKGGFANATKEGWDSIKEAEEEYHNDMVTLETTAGTTFETIKSGADDAYEKTLPLVQENQDLIDKYGAEVLEIQKTYDAVEELRKKYVEAEDAAKKATEAAYKYEHAELEKEIEEIQDSEPDKTPEPEPEKNPEPEPPKNPEPEPPKTGTGSGTVEVGDKVSLVSGGKLSVDSYTTPNVNPASWVKTATLYVQKIVDTSRKAPYHIGTSPTFGKGPVGWVNKKQISGYDTGGYTGTWDNSGRLAMLHQKELVLNAKDTENMLNTVAIMRGLTYSLGSTMLSRLAGATASGYSGGGSDSDGILEQNVHIDATFPNVKNATEIEEALNNLVNAASQRAYERR